MGIAGMHRVEAVAQAQDEEARVGPRWSWREGPHGLTRQEARTVRAIQALTGPDGVAPTYRQIGARIGVVHSRVAAVIVQLQRKGWLDRSPAQGRSLRLLQTLPPADVADAVDAALEHQSWSYTQGTGLFSQLAACGIEAPAQLTEAEAAGLLAEHYAGLQQILKARETGNG